MTAAVGHKFDEVLRNLAGQAGSLEALLRVFFSFLHRNTDFYVTFDPATTTRAGMGFPSGKAEQLLLAAFRSFPYKPYGGRGGGGGGGGAEHQRRRPAVRSGNPTAVSSVTPAAAPSNGSAPRGQEDPPSGAGSSGRVSPGAVAPGRGGGPASKSEAAAPATSSAPETTPPSPPAQPPPGEEPVAAAVPSSRIKESAGAAGGGIRVRYTKEGKQVPIGNGGVTPRYYWTQTVSEATVYVDVPPGTRSKDVHCVIQPRRLKLRVRGAGPAAAAPAPAPAPAPGAAGALNRSGKEPQDDGYDVIFDGELPSAVSREGSMWSLNDGTTVVISFEKTTKSWWKSVVEGDPEIDTSQVDSTTKVSEYDGETQGAIRKIMFDHRQKSLGLPTSDQLSADAVLERAKGLPGSPFLPGGLLFEGGGGGGGGVAPDGGVRDPPSPPSVP